AHVEALERPAVVAASEHRPGREKLIERELPVKDVATGQTELAFQIQRGKRAQRDNACAEAGSVAVHRVEHQLGNLVPRVVPRSAAGKLWIRMLAEQARDVLAWRRERRIDQRWDKHLDDGLARPAVLPRVEVSALHVR